MDGAVIPPVVGFAADHLAMRVAMMVPALCFAYVLGVSMLGKAIYE